MHIESGAEALQMSCDTLMGSARQTNRLKQQLWMIRAKRTHFRVRNEKFGAIFFKNERSTVVTFFNRATFMVCYPLSSLE